MATRKPYSLHQAGRVGDTVLGRELSGLGAALDGVGFWPTSAFIAFVREWRRKEHA